MWAMMEKLRIRWRFQPFMNFVLSSGRGAPSGWGDRAAQTRIPAIAPALLYLPASMQVAARAWIRTSLYIKRRRRGRRG
jgi:hypothetical protein